MRRHSCRPSPTPRYGSSKTMSGAVRATSSSASSAVPAEPTGTRPGSDRSSAMSPARMAGWGSTMAMRVTPGTLPAEAQGLLKVSRRFRERRLGTVFRREAHDRRRRRVPRPARLRRAAGKARAPAVRRGRPARPGPGPHGAHGRRPARSRPGARRAAAVPRHHRPRRRGRGRRLRLLRDPRRPARGARGRRVGAALDRRARAGDDRPRRHLLRAADDPGDGPARRDDRAAGAERLAGQLHQPGRHGHRGRAAGARRPRGRHLRLALRPLPARRPRARPAPGSDVVRLLRAQPPRLAQGGPRRRARPPPRPARRRRGARRLRGGPLVRRRLAAGARDDPQRVPVLLLRGRGGPHGREPARRLPARVAGRVLRAERSGPGRGARRLARDARRARPHLHGRRAARRGGRGRPRRRRRGRRLRGRGDGGRRGDRQQHAGDHDPQHRQPLRAAVPRRARGGRGALHRRAHRPGAGRGRARPAPRAGARDRDQGRRADHDRGRAGGLAGACDPRARAAPAGAERRGGAADLRRLPQPAPRARGALRMSVDVVVTATAFMDLTFIGLESVPGPGEERFAGDLIRSPGGGAINAIGAARLGLKSALSVPLGADVDGRSIREALEAEGIALSTSAATRTPTTVVMPWGGERAMVTYEPVASTSADEVAAFEPRAVIVALDQLDIVPSGVRGYAPCGDDDARAFAAHPPRDLGRARALFVNRREALLITGEQTPEKASERLGADVDIVVVTLGPDGAMARAGGELVRVDGFPMDVVDTTGAGDLLCAAFVWADLSGADLELALRWSVLYGSLSLSAPGGPAGAVALERRLEEGSPGALPPLATHKETRT